MIARLALSWFVALTLAVSAAGCGGDETATQEEDQVGESAEELGATIFVWHPDLTVSYQPSSRSQGFLIANPGQASAGRFRVAVLASAQSYSFYVAGLAAGASQRFALPPLGCGQRVTVLVDVDNAVAESSESNNLLAMAGWCSQ